MPPRPQDLSPQDFFALEDVLRDVTDAAGAKHGSLQLFDGDRTLVVVAARGFKKAFIDAFRRLPLDAGTPCTRAFGSGRIEVLEDSAKDAAYSFLKAAFEPLGIRACRSIPLMDARDVPFGVVSVHWLKPRPSLEWELPLLRVQGREAARRVQALH